MFSLFLLPFILVGCSDSKDKATKPRKQIPVPAYPLTITDDEAMVVTVERRPARIVSLAPQFTETLFALNLGDRIVGVSAGETYPPEATALPVVTGVDDLTPDIEKVKALSPDVVIAAGFAAAPWKQQIREARIAVATFNATGLDDSLNDMVAVGKLAGADSTGLTEQVKREVAKIRAQVQDAPPASVFVESFFPPLTGVGPQGFVADLLKAAGGVIAGPPDAPEVFPWSTDALATASPQFYVAPASTGISPEAIKGRPGFAKVAAVKESRIVILEDDLLFRPGPRFAEGLRKLALAFHPDRFPQTSGS